LLIGGRVSPEARFRSREMGFDDVFLPDGWDFLPPTVTAALKNERSVLGSLFLPSQTSALY